MEIRFEQGLKKRLYFPRTGKILDENILIARTFFLRERQKNVQKTVRELYVF
jgi:hypothetical protein